MYNYIKRERGLIMCFILLREKKACRNRPRTLAALERADVLAHYETERDVPFENFFIQEKQMEKK